MAVTVFYANQNMEDVGVLKGFKLDMSISLDSGNNDYEVRTSIDGIEMDEGYYIYAENSEYGGIVDVKRINTKTGTLYYSGRTWRGMLESKIIVPPTGQDYYTASGDLNVVLDQLITDFGLDDLFYTDSTPTGEVVSGYQFYRYTDVYSGIVRLLSERGYKLAIRFNTNQFKCELSAEPVIDYGDSQEVTSDLYDFDISKISGTVNHLIGLGSGELQDRLVVHKYADADGNISDVQTLFGKDEIVDTYEYSMAETREELEEQMLKYFPKLIGSDIIKITLNDIDAYVGDKLTVYDEYTCIEAVQYIQNKVITVDDYDINVQYSAQVIGTRHTSSGSGGSPYVPTPTTNNYNSLSNKPSINGHVLIGNQTGAQLGLISEADLSDALAERGIVPSRVKFDTTANWNSQRGLVSESNMVYVYTDYKTVDGQYIAGFKVGDGSAYLIDLPFVDEIYARHVNNTTIHITQAEREFWNNKNRAYVSLSDLENLVLTIN